MRQTVLHTAGVRERLLHSVAAAESAARALPRYTSSAGSFLRENIVRAPASALFVLMMWVAAIATSSVSRGPSQAVLTFVGVGTESLHQGRVWTLLSAGLWAPSTAGYLLATVMVLFAAAPLERRLGTPTLVAAAVLTQLGGTALGVLFTSITEHVGLRWASTLHSGVAVGPTTWIVGVVMAATVAMSTLWRWRIRVMTATLLITLVLFGGHLQDVIRLMAALVGLIVGTLLLGRPAQGRPMAGTQREGRLLVALVLAASAIGPILAALSPNAIGPFAGLKDVFGGSQATVGDVRALCAAGGDPQECREGLAALRLSGVGPTMLAIMPTVFVLAVADGVRRGRRGAWWAAVISQGVLIGLAVLNVVLRYIDSVTPGSVFYGLEESSQIARSAIPVLTPIAILALLLWSRRLFDATAPAGSYRRFGYTAVLTVASLFVLFVGGGLLFATGFDPAASFTTLIAEFPNRLIPPVDLQWLDPRLLPTSTPGTVLFEWTGVVFWLVLTFAMFRTFLKPAGTVESGDVLRARDILRSTGGGSLSWMTTWRGNQYWFDEAGTGFIAYRVIGRVAITSGSPVCPPCSVRESVVRFADFCVDNGWTPCLYSVSAEVRSVTDKLGWSSVQVAQEAVLNLSTLAFTGKKFQDVRTSLNSAHKAGVHAEWVSYPDAPFAITDQIAAISEEWVADKGMPEMGFTLGGLDELDDHEVRCLIAVDEHRTIHAITSWMPVYRDGLAVGWTMDFMRRRADGFRPAVEFLIASAAMMTKSEGAQFLSLSGAPLANATTAAEADQPTGVMDRTLGLLGRTLEPVYGFRSLLAFKSKFQPDYSPLYMAFPDPAALASIGSAITKAYLPELSARQSVRLMTRLLRRS
ncbi:MULTISPECIES: bifunctional lysylphosphatidylglycerol flippase/synthetase MprF [Rhodococcus]|uniref:bifunctional lysylphosphatidylglycerol flippase/synthetase MprF n=1 Tax=Rhodococcus TaxID=1827 RepID=UPI0009E7D0F2|nr:MULTISPECIES: DUF2156 domain-containing protein [Rhodococcus]MEA1798301.1 DUF2156 domain-containing protein [Rhodococcus qingshengii]